MIVDVLYVFDINTTRCDIGGNQDRAFLMCKCVHGFDSLVLRFISVNGCDRESFFL